jgi:TatD DNase family protein
VPHRGKRNEPAFVALTAKHIAELRGITPEELGAATSANFRRFFSLDY